MNQQHSGTTKSSLGFLDRAARFILGTGVMLLVLTGVPGNSGSIFALTVVNIYLIITALMSMDPVYKLVALFLKLSGSLIIASPQGQQV